MLRIKTPFSFFSVMDVGDGTCTVYSSSFDEDTIIRDLWFDPPQAQDSDVYCESGEGYVTLTGECLNNDCDITLIWLPNR